VKTVIIGIVVAGAGFAGAKLLPMAIVKLAKKPEWTIGWKPTILTGASTLVLAGIGYGLGRLFTNKRQAMLIAIEVGVGGAIATGHEAWKAWKISRPAPAPQQTASRGVAGFSPDQYREAQNAATILNRGGVGYFSPEQYARATTGGALLTGQFTAEKNF